MAEQYTLKVVIDDSKIRELESRLNKLGGGSSGSSTTSGGGSGISGMLGKLGSGGGAGGTSGLMKNLAKLGAIAVGIIGIQKMVSKISGLVVQASPMLQGMMKLFNTSVLMIFRPLGDFIGFFLRPIMIFLLRNVALPLYQLLAPPLRQWGSSLGNTLVGFLSDPFGTLTQWWLTWNWFDGIGLNKIQAGLTLIEDVLKIFNIDLSGVSLALSESFTTALDNITTGLTEAFDGITGFFTDSWAFVTSTLQPAWDGLTGFFQSIIDTFSGFIDWLHDTFGWLLGGGDDSGSTTEIQNAPGSDRGNRSSSSNTNNMSSSGYANSGTNFWILNSDGSQNPGSINDISPEVQDTIQRSGRNTRFS